MNSYKTPARSFAQKLLDRSCYTGVQPNFQVINHSNTHSFHLNPNKLSPKPKDLSRVPSPTTRGIGDKSYVGSGARPQGTLAWHLAESPQSISRRQCRPLPNTSQTSARTRNVGKTVCRKMCKGRLPKIKNKGILPDGCRDFLRITASSWRQEMQPSSTNDANQAAISY